MLTRIVAFILLLPSILLAQHSIKGTFSPAKDYTVALLYKATPTVSQYVTNAEINEDGSFEIKLDSTAKKGIYRLVYGAPQEDYNFDIIYNAKEDIALTFNSETGVAFQSSLENKLLASYTNSMSMITHSIGKFFREQSTDTLALLSIFKTQRDTQLNFENTTKGSIAFHFIKANTPYTPEGFEDVNTYIHNLNAHYFDHVDFNNKTLQSSSFLEERMLNYVFGMEVKSENEVDCYIKNIEIFCTKIKKTPEKVKRILLLSLWEQMVDLNHASVANYIAETYLMDIAVSLNDQELLYELLNFANTSIGRVAPDFSIKLVKDKKTTITKLSELDIAENYILTFWSSSCSHCLMEIPQLQTFIKTLKQNKVKVIAIGLEKTSTKWKALIKELPSFIHVYGAGKWDNEIGNSYNVTATPSYFILDKTKHIIAKPNDINAIKKHFKAK